MNREKTRQQRQKQTQNTREFDEKKQKQPNWSTECNHKEDKTQTVKCEEVANGLDGMMSMVTKLDMLAS